MKTFLNDTDGLSLYEFMALLIVGAFIVITLIILVMILRGIDVSQMLDFYKSFITVPTTVVGGIFLQGSAREVWGRRQANKLADDVMGKDSLYGGYYGSYGNYTDDYSSNYQV